MADVGAAVRPSRRSLTSLCRSLTRSVTLLTCRVVRRCVSSEVVGDEVWWFKSRGRAGRGLNFGQILRS